MARAVDRTHVAAAALTAGIALGLAAAPAGASTASLVDVPAPPCKIDPCTGPLTDTALLVEGGAEANSLTIVRPADAIRIRDRTARIRPGRGCARVDDHRVECPLPTAVPLETPVYVVTGRGRDLVRSGLRDIPVTIDGGPGDDVLEGGARDDILFGGAGMDRLRGLGGDDRLHDASLRDPRPPGVDSAPVFPRPTVPPGRGRDHFDGGEGSDSLSYEGRAGRLTIDLASHNGVSGAGGERDSIRRVENATGGSGDDRIRGGRGANSLAGGDGDDRLAGRAGSDALSGGRGTDVVSGGSGDDRIDPLLELPLAGAGDRLRCGPGRDLVGGAYPSDSVREDCERVGLATASRARLEAFALRSHLPLRRARSPRVLSGTLTCLSQGEVCQVVAEVRVLGRVGRRGTAPPADTLLGIQKLSIAGPRPLLSGSPAEEQQMDLRLSADGLRLLRRHRALRARVVVTSQYAGPDPPGYVTRLRAP